MPAVLRAKCIIAGDSAVGKSALTQVFHSDGAHYPKNYAMTVGVELCVKSVTIPDTSDTVELFLHDSAGKETFSDLVPKHWSQPSVIMIVYDVTSETSFSSCAKWLERVKSQKPEVSTPGVLVAAKKDLDARRVVSPKAGQEFAMSNGLEYFEVSAKEGENVEAPFYYLANEFHKLYNEKLDTFQTLS